MRLKPAPGSPEMIRAHSNTLVHEIVYTLLQAIDQELFRNVALFLNTYNQGSQQNFSEALSDLRTNTLPDEEGFFSAPAYLDTLVRNLEALYQHNENTLGFLRGAILEQLALRLISQRCLSSECFSNQLFLDKYGKEVTGQIDVGALSNNEYFVEGYECKIKAKGTYGLASKDCDNLKALVRVAHDESYYVHVGVISFDSDNFVKSRLEYFDAPPYIKAYGLDSIIDLLSLPQYIEPDDDIEN